MKKDLEVINPKEKELFENENHGKWRELFSDSCTEDWSQQWFLDGEVGTVTHSPEGMTMTAGPEFKNDAHHMVLWTKENFSGDLKIEYDYVRLDDAIKCVNILYIQATGSGESPYETDISQWNDLRKVPSMRMYYDHMNVYHVSYAAFGNTDVDDTSYIRGRRYMPNAPGLKGSDLKPDYWPEDLFETGEPHHLTFIKKDLAIYLKVENDSQEYYCRMSNTELPAVTFGRVGLRQMFTRSARYKNLSIQGV